jgi:predicted Zn-dependent protease
MKIKYFLLLLLILFSCGFAENPVNKDQQLILMSEEDEMLLGLEADLKIKAQFGVYDDPFLVAYVNEVGQKIAKVSARPNIPYYFTILDTSFVNAFALPGGYVYVTRGMLSHLNSEAELANVLAHELTHISARHGVQQLSQQSSYKLAWVGAGILLKQQNLSQWKQLVDAGMQIALLGYSREYEFEADLIGAEYAMKAGYSPRGMRSFLMTLQTDEEETPEFLNWLLTHPPTEERIELTSKREEELLKDVSENRFLILSDKFKASLSGLLLGARSTAGEIKGRQYKNKYYGFRITAPKEWQLQHQPGALVIFKAPQQKYSVYVQAVKLQKKLGLTEWIEKVESGFSGSIRKIKGVPLQKKEEAYSIFYEEKISAEEIMLERRDYIVKEKVGFVITYLAKRDDFNKGFSSFDQIFESFAFLNKTEMALSFASYLKVYTVEKEDTLDRIAQKVMGCSALESKRYCISRLEKFNGLRKKVKLYFSQKIKIPPKRSY